MIKISHRGNLAGKKPEMENRPDYVVNALAQGYDCEIDVWRKENKWFLGHDEPTYLIPPSFLSLKGLWIHFKNKECYTNLGSVDIDSINAFWHENDTLSVTSKGNLWTCDPSCKSKLSVLMIPDKPHYQCFTEHVIPPYLGISGYGESPRRIYEYEGFMGVCNDWIGKNDDTLNLSYDPSITRIRFGPKLPL